MKSCNFTDILKAKKLNISRLPSSNKIIYYFASLGLGIAEYNDRPIIEKKKKKMGGSVLENGRKSRKMKSIVPDLSEKFMACMQVCKILVSVKALCAILLLLLKIFTPDL